MTCILMTVDARSLSLRLVMEWAREAVASIQQMFPADEAVWWFDGLKYADAMAVGTSSDLPRHPLWAV